MVRVLKPALRYWRALAGENTAVERTLRKHYRAVERKLKKKSTGTNFSLFRSGSKWDNRVGIYMKGSCDLPLLFRCESLIRRVMDGTCCVIHEGSVANARSDLLLQTLQDLPQEWVSPVIERLKLPADYFQPRLFDNTFVVPGTHGLEEFPKRVIIISIGADVTRTLYRHREHGFLTDPGGWWLNQSFDTVLADLSAANWFRKNFVSVGKISVDAFVDNFTNIIEVLRNKTDAHILVFNVLTVEPGDRTHSFQFVKNCYSMRRREFDLALVELSRKLDFSIVDIDRILKRVGIRKTQVDSNHYPREAHLPIAKEAFRIMRELKVF